MKTQLLWFILTPKGNIYKDYGNYIYSGSTQERAIRELVRDSNKTWADYASRGYTCQRLAVVLPE